jgi:hypothetical protein
MMLEGRLSWKAYVPPKCARFGIKSFELCEAKSGYVCNFIICIGQDTAFDDTLTNQHYGLEVVLDLMGPFLNQGYHVTMGSWFFSPELYDKLCSKQINTVGTLCQNGNGVPVEIKKAKLEKGEHLSIFKDKFDDNEVER